MWVEGECGLDADQQTNVMFETILGVLRAWRQDAGEHDQVKMFYWSANNLPAHLGGRHSRQDSLDHPPVNGEEPWALHQLRDFAGHVLRNWIGPQVTR